ncbi:hypothetical protein [Methylovulum miyakonense]|uniref:hypothetical protein n=1 Tax=Methylovulum miyakonense TaxID=645578 RepID=UPI0003758471|nr:hypothetical protein [Methylovulum miyakonense]
MTANGTIQLWDAKMPTIKEWPPESLEEQDDEWAFKELFGKNADEALAQIKFNPFTYIENLGVMPAPAFRFYFKVLVEYLLSNDPIEYPGAAEGVFGLIKYDIESGQNKSAELRSYLPPILREIAGRQGFYDADIGIFGDFKQKAEEIIRLLG